MYTLSLTCNEYIYGMQYYLHVFRITKASLFIFFTYIAQHIVLKTFSSVKIMTRILTRMARTVTRMTRMARWLAH